MNQYSILRNEAKISLKEFREAIIDVSGFYEAGEYCYYDELTGEKKCTTGEGEVFFIGEKNSIGDIRLNIEYGLISVQNTSLDICKDLCVKLKAGVRPVHYHGPNSPTPDYIYDYNPA